MIQDSKYFVCTHEQSAVWTSPCIRPSPGSGRVNDFETT